MNLFSLLLIFCPVVCFGSVDFDSIAFQPANISEYASAIKNVEPRIAGGSTASIFQYPYQGYLLRVVSNVGIFICGCSLIAPEWAVTAAQCLDGASSSSSFAVVFGTADLIGFDPDTTDPLHQLKTVTTYHRPTNYISASTGNDIGLLRLSSAVDIASSTVTPISLPCAGDSSIGIDETSCFISGWGDTDTSGSNPRYLQSASVTIVNNFLCNLQHSSNILSSQICTGSTSLDVSVCSGDGGGPLACRSSSDGSWVLTGISSIGPATCGNGVLPSVFTRASSYVDWITSTIFSVSPSTVSTLTLQTCKGIGSISGAENRLVIWLSASLVVLIGWLTF